MRGSGVPAPRRECDPCICGDKTTWHKECYARIQRGFKVVDEHGKATVLAETDGYVILRRKAAMPFIVHMTRYFKDWKPAP